MLNTPTTPDDMLGAMIAISASAPDMPLQSACLALSEVLASAETKLSREEGAQLVVLGAALWRKSQALGEDVLEIHHVTGPAQ